MRVAWIAVLMLFAVDAGARRHRQSQVPNGGEFGCTLCHQGFGGDVRNEFGLQVEATLVGGNVDWAAIFDLDADGDGYANGEELGDPEGVWRRGQPHPASPLVTHPSREHRIPCGNERMDGPELCDHADAGEVSCADQPGFFGGVMGCTEACDAYILDGCNLCGNDALDDEEVCDGEVLPGDCEGLGFFTGVLACGLDCELDTSGCHDCGNSLRDEDEDCEGADLGGFGCVDLGFDGGALVCDGACGFDTSACTTCGDGVVEGDEVCDTDDLQGRSCEGEGFVGGGLRCVACVLDASGCHDCGDGERGEDEACEGDDLGEASCEGLGFDGGDLGCDAVCGLDTSDCTTCGDGVAEGAEV